MTDMSNYRTRFGDDRSPGEKRVWWSEIENKWLLDFIKDMQVVKSLVRKRQKNAGIFKTIESKMKRRGSNKTWLQIRSRWKRMKGEYIRVKKFGSRGKLRRAASQPEESFFYKNMTEVLGKYSDKIECTSAYLGEEEDDDKVLVLYSTSNSIIENGTKDGEVKVQVELIEGDGVLDQDMTVVDPDVQEIKQEPLSPPASPQSGTDIQECRSKEPNGKKRSSESSRKRPAPDTDNSTCEEFAEEYARKHAKYMGEWQEQYQEWFQKQMEEQQQWEETFIQEQMELAKSTLESVATTFLQNMQQVLENIVKNTRHRTLTPFIPSFPSSRSIEINGNESPVFLNADETLTSGSLADESSNNM